MSQQAGWAPDPSGRFEYRYWDGGRWTEHVSTGNVTAIDPPVAAPPAPQATPPVANPPIAPPPVATPPALPVPLVREADAPLLAPVVEASPIAYTPPPPPPPAPPTVPQAADPHGMPTAATPVTYVDPAPAPQPVVAPRRRRPIWPMAVASIVAVAVGVGVVVLALGDDDKGATVATTPTDDESADEPEPTSVADTDGAGSTVGDTQPPPSIDPPASAISVAPTLPADPNDLGLSVPISRPPCDGSYVTAVGAITSEPDVAAALQTLLDRYPGASYMLTEDTCPSLRPRTAAGDRIWMVFFGPFTSVTDACDARSLGPADAYLRVLNTAAPSPDPIACP